MADIDEVEDPVPLTFFDPPVVEQHICQHHPGCPKGHRHAIVARVNANGWKDPRLGRAVGLSMENYLRHEITGYDRLLKLGVDRNELRKMIRPEIEAVLKLWALPAEANATIKSDE